MARQSAPDLDDGELLLPPDIVSEIGSHRKSSTRARIESLASQLATVGLLAPCPIPTPNPNRPILAVKPPPQSFGSGHNGDQARVGTGAFLPGSRPARQLNTSKPVQPQVANVFGSGRDRALQRPQLQQWQKMAPVRTYPIQFNEPGRLRKGTGVFLPRVTNTNEVTKKPDGLSKKPARMKTGQHQMQPKNKRSVAITKVVPLIQITEDIKLPQEWTY